MKDSNDKMREDMRFRWQPSQRDPHFALIQYLRQNWTSPQKGIKESLELLWLPLACQNNSHFSPQQVEQMGRRSIYFLRSQIDLICEKLDLPNPYESESQLLTTQRTDAETQEAEVTSNESQSSSAFYNMF